MKEKISYCMNKTTLFIVPTPIGNLRDITLRAIDVLNAVDLIVCEDTRHTLKLLNHYGIKKPLVSCEKFSEARKSQKILAHLQRGKNIAMVSDAGTPMISDPGTLLLGQARKVGVRIEALPGPCAFVTALSASGFTGPIRFIGFFPRKKTLIDQALMRMRFCPEITIFYESPKRIFSTLQALHKTLDEREICLAREITKFHEDYIVAPVGEMLAKWEGTEMKGECTVLVRGQAELPESEENLEEKMRSLRQKGYAKRDILKILVEFTGLTRNELYKLLLRVDSSIDRTCR